MEFALSRSPSARAERRGKGIWMSRRAGAVLSSLDKDQGAMVMVIVKGSRIVRRGFEGKWF